MKQSESIKNLASALVKAQAEMEAARKDAKNPFFRSKYADLNTVIAALKEPFSKYGLSYSQFPLSSFESLHPWDSVEKEITLAQISAGIKNVTMPQKLQYMCGVETILMHESGEYISHSCMFPTVKNDPQACGSAITYARRYALQAIAGLPTEDDDANAASYVAQKKHGPVIAAAQDIKIGSMKIERNTKQHEFLNACLKKLNLKSHLELSETQKDKIINSLSAMG